MKKVISILLTLSLMMTCCVVSASAQGKITDTLQAKMDAADEDDLLREIIWLDNPVDEDEVFLLAIKECGYIGGLPLNMTMEEVNAYRAVYNRIISEQEDAAVDDFIKKFGLDEASINETYCLCINANLTKAQIEAAATFREVESIYYDDSGETVIEEPMEGSGEPPYLYRESFHRQYVSGNKDAAYGWGYRELYYHKDENGETDWALVYAYLPMCSPIELVAIVGNRVLHPGAMYDPFDTCYGIYDVKEDKFIDASSIRAKDSPDFVRTFDEIGAGRLLGDIDGDDEISIVDATLIQRCEANMCDYPEDDEFSLTSDWGKRVRYYSDFNRDGERDIIDVTTIQRYLVNMD